MLKENLDVTLEAINKGIRSRSKRLNAGEKSTLYKCESTFEAGQQSSWKALAGPRTLVHALSEHQVRDIGAS